MDRYLVNFEGIAKGKISSKRFERAKVGIKPETDRETERELSYRRQLTLFSHTDCEALPRAASFAVNARGALYLAFAS